jgi:hypothetical protein
MRSGNDQKMAGNSRYKTMNPPHIIKKHGGARKGAGRKPGSGSKRSRITRSISLPTELWARIDKQRGKVNRSRWIEGRINEPTLPTEGAAKKP